jgi:flagellar protein FliO/FliZ
MTAGPDYLQAALALAFVLGLLLVVAAGLSRWRGRLPGAALASGRLSIVEQRSLDPRHRLMLVRWDRGEHLLVVGQTGTTLIASGSGHEAPTISSSVGAA